MKKTTLLLFFLFLANLVFGQEKKDSTKAILPSQSFVSNHAGFFGVKIIAYKATAKEIHLKNNKGEPVVAMWSVAYTQFDKLWTQQFKTTKTNAMASVFLI